MRSQTTADPWLERYDPGVPRTLEPYPNRTLLSYVKEAAAQRPEQPFLLFKGNRISYGEIEHLSDSLAAALIALGVAKGDRMAVVLPNCPQFVITLLGAWKAGAVVAPLNPLYSARELTEALNRLGAKSVVALTRSYALLKAIQPKTPVERVVATNIKEYLPAAMRLMYTMTMEQSRGDRVAIEPSDMRFQELLAENANAAAPKVAVTPDDAAVILMSGGTTGTPKGVIGLHGGLAAAGLQGHAWLNPVLTDWVDVNMLPLPLFHVLGIGALAGSLVGRNPLALVPDPSDLTDLLQTIRQVRPALFFGVPALFVALLARHDVQAGKVDLRSIKMCFSGAAPLLAKTKKRFEETTGGRILEGYSCTEAMFACTAAPALGAHKIGSVGLPLPNVEVQITGAGSGALPPGAVGEIWMRAPQVMPGYWQNPEETTQAFKTDELGRAWLCTGDLGYMDAEGYLFIVDRKKDLIKTSGYQVWPREIEEVIASHPAVAEVAVAGVPHPQKGEVAQAWVVLRDGAGASEDEIRAYCRARLAPYKVPARVEFISALPKSAAGKVLRRTLVADAGTGAGPTPRKLTAEER
jgi:long-chain acyl-CoA synthetase